MTTAISGGLVSRSAASFETVAAMSVGLAGLFSILVNGPSVSVSSLSAGRDFINAARRSPSIIVALTEK